MKRWAVDVCCSFSVNLQGIAKIHGYLHYTTSSTLIYMTINENKKENETLSMRNPTKGTNSSFVIMVRDNERNVGLPWKAAVKLSRSSTWDPQLGLLRRRQEVGGNWYRRRWSVSKLASWLAARPPRCVHSPWLPWTRSKVDGVEASPQHHDYHEETFRTDLSHSTVQCCSQSVYKAIE